MSDVKISMSAAIPILTKIPEQVGRGSVVRIQGDLHASNRYIVVKIKGDTAKLRHIPLQTLQEELVENLEAVTQTAREVTQDYKKHHGYTGL